MKTKNVVTDCEQSERESTGNKKIRKKNTKYHFLVQWTIAFEDGPAIRLSVSAVDRERERERERDVRIELRFRQLVCP